MGAKLDSGVGSKRGRPEVNAEPNVIPFIDVMLVLLIIFMVTAPIAAVDIKTSIPESQVFSSKRNAKPVWVTLVDGEDCGQTIKGVTAKYCPAVYVMEKNVEMYQLGEEALKAMRYANPGIPDSDLQSTAAADPNDQKPVYRIYLRASGTTRYKNVTEVMKKLQDYSLVHIALVTNDKNQ